MIKSIKLFLLMLISSGIFAQDSSVTVTKISGFVKGDKDSVLRGANLVI